MKRSLFSEEQIICDIKRTREWLADEGCVPPTWRQFGNIPQCVGPVVG